MVCGTETYTKVVYGWKSGRLVHLVRGECKRVEWEKRKNTIERLGYLATTLSTNIFSATEQHQN
jgi:type II secretory pathway component PulJ